MSHVLKGKKQSPWHIAARVAARQENGNYCSPHFVALNKSRVGQPLSDAHKRKISAAHKGKQYALGTKRSVEFRRRLADYWAANRERHNHYVDGKGWERTSERVVDMQRLDYRLWREDVFRRDDWTCVECGTHGGDVQADHIKPYAIYPELRYDVSNGRTLCVGCHRKTPTYGGRLQLNATVVEATVAA